jgi:hypothetical protein
MTTFSEFLLTLIFGADRSELVSRLLSLEVVDNSDAVFFVFQIRAVENL